MQIYVMIMSILFLDFTFAALFTWMNLDIRIELDSEEQAGLWHPTQ